jgi:hypothetical protein
MPARGQQYVFARIPANERRACLQRSPKALAGHRQVPAGGEGREDQRKPGAFPHLIVSCAWQRGHFGNLLPQKNRA